MIPKTAVRLDNYLLVHQPLLWSCRLVPMVYYNLIIFCLFMGIINVVPLDLLYGPDPKTFAFCHAFFSLVGVVVWLNYQKLLDSVYYHGAKTQYFSSRSVALFLGVFVFVFLLIVIPFIRLNQRIANRMTDPHLPIGMMDFPPDYSFYPFPNDIPTGDLDSLKWAFAHPGIPHHLSFNPHLVLGSVSFWNYRHLSFGGKDTAAWLRFPIHPDDQPANDTLVVFYNSALRTDTILSDHFGLIIYSRKIGGKVINRRTGILRDTSIGRFFFYSRVSRDTICCDSMTVQIRGWADALAWRYTEETTKCDPGDRAFYMNERKDSYFAVRGETDQAIPTLWAAAFIGCLAGLLLLFAFLIIRFFGPELFFIALSFPVILGSPLILSYDWREAMNDAYPYILFLPLFLTALLLAIRRRRPDTIIWLQVIFNISVYLIAQFPFSTPNPMAHLVGGPPIPLFAIHTTIWRLCGSTLALVCFAVVFVEKSCRLYVRPGG